MLFKLIHNNSPISIFGGLVVFLVFLLLFFNLHPTTINYLFVVNSLAFVALLFYVTSPVNNHQLFEGYSFASSVFLALLLPLVLNAFPNSLIGIELFVFNLFLIVVTKIYDQNDVKNLTFLAGLSIGVLMLFNLLLGGLVVTVVVMLFLSRGFKWREWLLAVIGLILPFVYDQSLKFLGVSYVLPVQKQLLNFSITDWGFVIYSGVTAIVTFFMLTRKTVRKQNLFIVLALSVVVLLIVSAVTLQPFLYVSLPAVAILAAHIYISINNKMLRTVWLIIHLLVGIIPFIY